MWKIAGPLCLSFGIIAAAGCGDTTSNTPADMSAINARMAAINTHIQAQAAANGYAYFALSALYDLPKGSLDMYKVLFSSTPFGPNMSLDGVHPNAAGQTILANAAVAAVNARYGTVIP